ncbi:MAG: [FeFe] hydrogenase H-cluster maturation GTPase HydF [Firmicutes bacterium]|nr:[FeFe] hydrogenase H-cluster maturation GTPase HydF [Bacillota bacterium]
MSLDKTPRSNRYHIAILGRMNSGKSSLINALAQQDVAVVSSIAGTTTDAVHKAMEIHGTGPVVFIDTPGVDDASLLSEARITRTKKAIDSADLAIVVIDAPKGEGEPEQKLYAHLEEKQVPYIVAVNKIDIGDHEQDSSESSSPSPGPGHRPSSSRGTSPPYVHVSAKTQAGRDKLLKAISEQAAKAKEQREPPIVGDLINPGEIVLLVIPLDEQAPKGRLILPQVQTIRDILDHNGVAVAVKVEELGQLFAEPHFSPQLVVTDSQVFQEVDKVVPPSVPLTSFSILFARHKGNLKLLAQGAQALDLLQPGDMVLIAEACTHHPIADDIGTVQIPRLIDAKVGGALVYEWQKGGDYPEDLTRYKLIIHCGGCMLNRRAMCSRLEAAAHAGVPITNYGMTIAACHGILPRALGPFRKTSLI